MSDAGVKKIKAKEEGAGRRQVAEIKLICTEKDIYTKEEVAEMLHINKHLAYKLIKLPEDPLPARQLRFRTRGYLVTRRELNEWVERNAPLLGSPER